MAAAPGGNRLCMKKQNGAARALVDRVGSMGKVDLWALRLCFTAVMALAGIAVFLAVTQ